MENVWIYSKTYIHTQTELKTDATDQGLQGFNKPIAWDSSSESTHMSESCLSGKLSGDKKLLLRKVVGMSDLYSSDQRPMNAKENSY